MPQQDRILHLLLAITLYMRMHAASSVIQLMAMFTTSNALETNRHTSRDAACAAAKVMTDAGGCSKSADTATLNMR